MKGPWRITFDTNPDDCNLKCIMCEGFSPHADIGGRKDIRELELIQKKPEKRRMDISLVKKVMEEVAPYNSLKEIIPSTMGEPLLYRDFDQIIDLCKEYGVKLNLTTNGTFPRKGVERWAEMLIPVCSDVKISWNGATKETQEEVMRNSDFEKQMSNLKHFLNVRDRVQRKGGNYCTVTLQITFMEINYQEFPELVKLAANLGIDRIKGHHLWAHFEQIKDQNMRRDAQAIERWNEVVDLMELKAEEYRRPDGSKIHLDNIYKLGSEASDRLLSESVCPFLKEEGWIATDGRFNPCCAPDVERRTLGYFGNVKEQSFDEIWESDGYKKLTEHYDDFELCKSCNMRKAIS